MLMLVQRERSDSCVCVCARQKVSGHETLMLAGEGDRLQKRVREQEREEVIQNQAKAKMFFEKKNFKTFIFKRKKLYKEV
jgi:hypothetical protein